MFADWRKCRKWRVARAESDRDSPPDAPAKTLTPSTSKNHHHPPRSRTRIFTRRVLFLIRGIPHSCRAPLGIQGVDLELGVALFCPAWRFRAPIARRPPPRAEMPAGADCSEVEAGDRRPARALHPARAPPCREVEGGSPGVRWGNWGHPPKRVCPGVPLTTQASGAPPAFSTTRNFSV